jgi:DNA-binding NtrC family response regulator
MKKTILNEEKPLILIVDDVHESIQLLINILGEKKYRISMALSGEETLEKVNRLNPDLILLDLAMPGISGEEVLEIISIENPHIPIIITTSTNDPKTILRCAKSGAFDYIIKPIDSTRTITSVKNALKWKKQENEIQNLKKRFFEDELELELPDAFKEIITKSRKMHMIFKYAESIAKTSQPVLITGETGTGKELMAKAIHNASGRDKKFVSVNVAGLDDQLFSDTLFGHLKGAFTGAGTIREGLIAKAENGTLFLDEIGDLSKSSQVKLLRLLQEKEYFQIGSDTPRYSNCRILMATHRDLQELVITEKFREDLFYRLYSHHICLPPLRENKDDILILLNHFLSEAAVEMNKKKPPYPPELIKLLENYFFPGNIRELRGMVFEAMIRNTKHILSMNVFKEKMNSKHYQLHFSSEQGVLSPETYFEKLPALPPKEEIDRILITEAWKRSKGNQSLTADILQLNRSTVAKQLKRYGLLNN